MHYITGNLMYPISNLSVTLDNVSYYIMHSGTCDFSEPTLCKLQLLFCSMSQAGASFKMHVRFAITLGTNSLGGELAHTTEPRSLIAEFYKLIQIGKAGTASTHIVCFHFSIPDSSFSPSVCCEAPSLDSSLRMKKPLPLGLVLPPSTSWFLQLGHPMLYSHPTHRPSVTHLHVATVC